MRVDQATVLHSVKGYSSHSTMILCKISACQSQKETYTSSIVMEIEGGGGYFPKNPRMSLFPYVIIDNRM